MATHSFVSVMDCTKGTCTVVQQLSTSCVKQVYAMVQEYLDIPYVD